jgi:hypothetical protein
MTDDHRTVAERQCRHSRTTYNEQDGTLYCEQCHSWMTDDAPRTVADVLTVASGRSALVLLHIDPDMPLDDWYRRLEMGERAENALAEHAKWRLSDKEALYRIRGD